MMRTNWVGAVAAVFLIGSSGGALADQHLRWDGVYFGGHAGAVWADPAGALRCDSVKAPFAGMFPDLGDVFLVGAGSEVCPNLTPPLEVGEVDGYLEIIELERKTDDFGWLWGAQFGVQKQFGSTVIGLEADISGVSGIDSRSELEFVYYPLWGPGWTECNGSCPNGYPDHYVSAKDDLDWLATFRARLGQVITDDGRGIGYITAGAAVARVTSSMTTWSEYPETNGIEYTGFFDPTTTTRDSFYQFGGAVGAGGEYAIDETISIGLEYLYVGLTGKKKQSVTYYGGPSMESLGAFEIEREIGFDSIQTLRFKVNIKVN